MMSATRINHFPPAISWPALIDSISRALCSLAGMSFAGFLLQRYDSRQWA